MTFQVISDIAMHIYETVAFIAAVPVRDDSYVFPAI